MPELIIQGRAVPLADITAFVLKTKHGDVHLLGAEARIAVRSLLAGEEILPNRVDPPAHPVITDPMDYIIGDVLVCVNPGHPEEWILIDTSNRILVFLVDGKRDTCTREEWTKVSQDWHRTRPPMEWLAERGVAPQLLDRVRAARAAENPHANNAPEGL